MTNKTFRTFPKDRRLSRAEWQAFIGIPGNAELTSRSQQRLDAAYGRYVNAYNGYRISLNRRGLGTLDDTAPSNGAEM